MKIGHRGMTISAFVLLIIGLLIVSGLYVQSRGELQETQSELQESHEHNVYLIQLADSLSEENADLIRQRDYMIELTEEAVDRLYERGCM